jgi:PASTA domain
MAVNRRLVIGGLIVGGGGIAAYEIYKYRKNKQAASAATTAAASAATGYGYGSQAYGYGASGYGYGGAGGGPWGTTYGYGASGGFPAGYYGYGVPTPPSDGGGGSGGGSPPSVASTTNAQWDQAAITQLSQDGYDPTTVAGALGAYLNGREVNSSQVNIVDAAIGIEGYPPVEGANGYPPAIKTGGTTGGGTGGGQNPNPNRNHAAKVIVPNVTGDRAAAARKKLRAVGLTYNISDKATGVVKAQNPRVGARSDKGDVVQLTLGK